MGELTRLFATTGLACVLALLLCRLVLSIGIVDRPDSERKAAVGHDKPTPSSGGLGFILAVLIAYFGLGTLTQFSVDITVLVLSAGMGASLLLGLADDITAMSAKVKLFLQIIIALGMAMYGVRAEMIEPGFDKLRDFGLIGGTLLSVLWIVTIGNSVNFMDGANGLAMGMAMFASMAFSAIFGFCGAWELAILSGGLAGALAGFLVWNTPGRLFTGDAGSLAVGAALGGLSLLLVKLRPDLMFVPPILLSPFLVDVILTLNLRIKRGDMFWEAHSDHVYQVALREVPIAHWQLSVGHWMIAANCAVLGFAGAMIGHEAPLVIFMGVVLMGVWMHIRIRRAAMMVGQMRAEAESG